MINLNEYLLSNKHKNAITGNVTGIKIPDDIHYSFKDVSVEDLITDVLYNFGDIISKNDLNKAFKGYEKSEFNILCWSWESYDSEKYGAVLDKMFPNGGYEEIYGEYKNDADLYTIIDEDINVIITRFISQDERSIYIIDSGDKGYIYLCIEK